MPICGRPQRAESRARGRGDRRRRRSRGRSEPRPGNHLKARASIPSSTPKARASNQSPRRIRTDRAPSLRLDDPSTEDENGQSVEPESIPTARASSPRTRATTRKRRRGQDGQSTEDEQSTEGEQSAEQEGDPGGDEGGGVTLPPEISEAIQSDINRLRGARTVTGDGATDPADDAGGVVDKTIAVPDKKGQLLGGDNFSPADDGALVGRAVPVSGPVGTSGGDIDFGPDHDDGVQTSGPEQDPFDSGPEIKPVGSNTTSDDEETTMTAAWSARRSSPSPWCARPSSIVYRRASTRIPTTTEGPSGLGLGSSVVRSPPTNRVSPSISSVGFEQARASRSPWSCRHQRTVRRAWTAPRSRGRQRRAAANWS